MDEQARPWYAAGLYRRIQERRKWQPERAPRKSWRERLHERGLHWSLEVVVGAFVAVTVASLVTVALATSGSSSMGHVGVSGGGRGAYSGAAGGGPGGSGGSAGAGAGGAGGGVAAFPSPTPQCIAAPIAGSPLRPCTY